MTKRIIIDENKPLEASLLSAIMYLANGDLQLIIDIAEPAANDIFCEEITQQAVKGLFLLLLRGIQNLAKSMLIFGTQSIQNVESSEAVRMFERVKELAGPKEHNFWAIEGLDFCFTYPGIWHLASLLSSVAKELLNSSVINVQPPFGINQKLWAKIMYEIAKRRPYLWQNHREAINQGYLEQGTSAVVSFPTGAGKSTIAEFKIASALLSGVKVVFLVPTLALLDQTKRTLKKTFSEVEFPLDENMSSEDIESTSLSAISVMTPECCLIRLSSDRNMFKDVGLLVFDECHLLHPKAEIEQNRRAVDAMLCLLNLSCIALKMDFLLMSAMMENTDQIAAWLKSLTSRKCLSLNLMWKPTRQVRGAVVYDSNKINEINAHIKKIQKTSKNKIPPKSLQEGLLVEPLGLFSLHQTWQGNDRINYALLPILGEQIRLNATKNAARGWKLTANGNQVASRIASASAAKGLKTLVFVQTIPLCNSSAKNISKMLGSCNIELTSEETKLLNVIEEELGDSKHMYLRISNGKLMSSSTCHHALLLPEERRLHESLFERKDGLNILVATSTLAQGMNLPGQVVILSGDKRFNQNASKMERLAAHELLNAAGRAGRAGHNSYGYVLVVPSEVIGLDDKKSQISPYWMELKEIFAKSDQCLKIEDPMLSLLDDIHSASKPITEIARYLVTRLPSNTLDKNLDDEEPVRTMLQKSFAAYKANIRNDQNWVESRIQAVIFAQKNAIDGSVLDSWANKIAGVFKFPAKMISELGKDLQQETLQSGTTTYFWLQWMFQWLTKKPEWIFECISQQNVEELFGKTSLKGKSDNELKNYVLVNFEKLLFAWISGHTLSHLNEIFSKKTSHCQNARKFVLKILPELRCYFQLPALILKEISKENSVSSMNNIALSTLGGCVQKGFNSPEKLALQYIQKGSRIEIHRQFLKIESVLVAASSTENFKETIRRVRQAIDETNGAI